jgi:serine phosphatase RsbU (regulator of sigma subunit)/anti-sigma regulatory factor (Ser/Thr protein kinase)
MFRKPIKEINAEFPAEDRYLDSIRRVVKESCTSVGMPRKDVSAVLLAIEEGATNVIRHAYLYEKGSLRLRIVLYEKFAAFSLIDTGRSFEPTSNGSINLDRLVESGRKGGLGFYMIQKIMDSVEYISSPDFNELRMVKRIRPSAASGPPLLRRMFTLRVKFSFWTFFIVALIVGSAFYFVNSRTSGEAYAHLDETVQALTKTVAEQSSGYIINRRSDVEFDELLVSYVHSNPMLRQIVLTDSLGLILAHSDDIRNIRKPFQAPEHLDLNQLEQPQRFSDNNEPLNFLIMPITSNQRALGRVYVTYSSAQIRQLLVDARTKILLVTGFLILMGIVGIYLLSNYFVTPILKITERVRRFSLGDLDTELPLEGADEFFEISRALNDMTTRLSRDRKNVIERERMAKEIEVASQIQKTLLPQELPHIPGLEVDAFYRAASLVGGDLYDIFQTGENRYCLVVADVSGKGVPASLVMSMLRTVIQIYAEDAVSARDTLLRVNEYLIRNMPPGMFITVLLAIYDSAARHIKIVSAGHNPMLLFQSDSGELMKVNPSGMPLGVDVTLKKRFAEGLQEITIDLQEGDLFVMYTDGITEAVNRDREQFGLERLSRCLLDKLSSGSRLPVSEISKSIVGEIDTFSGFSKQADDVTFLVCRATARVELPPSTDSIQFRTSPDAASEQSKGS